LPLDLKPKWPLPFFSLRSYSGLEIWESCCPPSFWPLFAPGLFIRTVGDLQKRSFPPYCSYPTSPFMSLIAFPLKIMNSLSFRVPSSSFFRLSVFPLVSKTSSNRQSPRAAPGRAPSLGRFASSYITFKFVSPFRSYQIRYRPRIRAPFFFLVAFQEGR